MSDLIWQMGAADTARAIREGKISSRDAVEAAIERSRAVNARVNAVTVDLSAAARARAKEADAAEASNATEERAS